MSAGSGNPTSASVQALDHKSNSLPLKAAWPFWNESILSFLSPGGKTLLTFKQESFADHVDPADVLKALGINEPVPGSPTDANASQNCDGDACAMPKKN